MTKAKQRIDKLEQKTGGSKRTIGVMASNSRVTRIWGKDYKDLPEHKKLIGMPLEAIRKTLRSYYEDERPPPKIEIINLERIITDDPRDLPQNQGLARDMTDAQLDTEIKKARPSKTPIAEPAEDPEKPDAPDAGDTRDIDKMTDEELEREIELAEKELKK